MFVNLMLSSVSGIFVLQSMSKGLGDKTLPIACAWWTVGSIPPSSEGLSYAGTISVIIGNCVVFGLATWYLHSRRQRLIGAVQTVGVLLMTAVAIGAAVRTCLLSQAFRSPSVILSDEGEKQWSFGQVLSILVLFYHLLSLIEINISWGNSKQHKNRRPGSTDSRSTETIRPLFQFLVEVWPLFMTLPKRACNVVRGE